MAEHDFFHPEEIDEQIEQYLPPSSAQSRQELDGAASQAIGDLQRYCAPSEQNAALQRVWQRFSEQRAALQSEPGQTIQPSLVIQQRQRDLIKQTLETSEVRGSVEPHEPPPMRGRQRKQEESPMQSQQQFSDDAQVDPDQSEQRRNLWRNESNTSMAETPYKHGEKLQVREKPGRRKLLLGGVGLVSFMLGGGVGASLYALKLSIQQKPNSAPGEKQPYEHLVTSANSATGRYQADLYENGTTTFVNIVELKNQTLINTMPIAIVGSLNGIQLYWSQNEKRLLFVSQDGTFQIFQVQYLRPLHTGRYTLKPGQRLKEVLFREDGDSVSIMLNSPDETQTFSIPG